MFFNMLKKIKCLSLITFFFGRFIISALNKWNKWAQPTHFSWVCQRRLSASCLSGPYWESLFWKVPACWESPLGSCWVSDPLLRSKGPAAQTAPLGLRWVCAGRGQWENSGQCLGARSRPERWGEARPMSCVSPSWGCALGHVTSWWSGNSQPRARTGLCGRHPGPPWSACSGALPRCLEGPGQPSWTAESESPGADSSRWSDLEGTSALK